MSRIVSPEPLNGFMFVKFAVSTTSVSPSHRRESSTTRRLATDSDCVISKGMRDAMIRFARRETYNAVPMRAVLPFVMAGGLITGRVPTNGNLADVAFERLFNLSAECSAASGSSTFSGVARPVRSLWKADNACNVPR